jgi:hypothetical protein
MKNNKTTYTTVAANVVWKRHQGLLMVRVMRDGLRQTRAFLASKFGGYHKALKKAQEYAQYLKNEATVTQFEKAYRRRGRPSRTEFFGRRLINN